MSRRIFYSFKLLFLFVSLNPAIAQWDVEWESGLFAGSSLSGWINFENRGGQ